MSRYQIIYADPPWSYRDKANAGKRGAGHHYNVMKPKDIARLPVGELAAPSAALFMWATWPMLPDALTIMAAWGFRYRTAAFLWVKTTREPRVSLWKDLTIGQTAFGMGHWTRANTEFVLLGTRGKIGREARNVRQVIHAPRQRHSAKPAETRERIVALLGDLPRVELFARERSPGWDAIGDELGTTLTAPKSKPAQRSESDPKEIPHADAE